MKRRQGCRHRVFECRLARRKTCSKHGESYRFSAFWLRSSVEDQDEKTKEEAAEDCQALDRKIGTSDCEDQARTTTHAQKTHGKRRPFLTCLGLPLKGSMHRPKTFVSEVGSPVHATGERSHNTSTPKCKLGILGPPVSPIPLAVRIAAETLASGPPTSWKLSTANSRLTLALTWNPNHGPQTSQYVLFPPRLMTVVASLSTAPAEWSLEQDNDQILCSLSWPSQTTATPNPTTPMAPSTIHDSGFPSTTTLLSPPPSPEKTSSPVPFLLPSSTARYSQSSPKITKQTQDAATEIPPELPNLCSPASTQTTNLRTFDTGVQASMIILNPTQDAETQTPAAPCKTAAHSKPHPESHNMASPPAQTTSNSVSTSYEPPQIPKWCKFCHSTISSDEFPLLHLFEQCGATPEELMMPIEKYKYEFGKKVKLPRRAIRAASTLMLSCHDPNVTISHDLITDFTMKLIPDHNEYRSFTKTTNELISSTIANLKSHLNIDPSTCDLSDIYTDIEPPEQHSSDDDTDAEYDDEPDWAAMAEYYTYFGHDDAYDECY